MKPDEFGEVKQEKKVGRMSIAGATKTKLILADRGAEFLVVKLHKIFSLDSGNTYEAEKRFIAGFEQTSSKMHQIHGSVEDITIGEGVRLLEWQGLPFLVPYIQSPSIREGS